MLVGYPEAAGGVLREPRYRPRYFAHGNEAVVLQVAEPPFRGDPDPPARILIEGIRVQTVEFAVSRAAPGTEERDLAVAPFVQAAASGEPDRSVTARQYGSDHRTRQALVRGEGGDGHVAKAVEAVDGGHPDTAFAILEESADALTGQAIGRREHVR